jgi:hypothetical protein
MLPPEGSTLDTGAASVPIGVARQGVAFGVARALVPP